MIREMYINYISQPQTWPAKIPLSYPQGILYFFFRFCFGFRDIKNRMMTYVVKLQRITANFPELHHVQRGSYLKHLEVHKQQLVSYHARHQILEMQSLA